MRVACQDGCVLGFKWRSTNGAWPACAAVARLGRVAQLVCAVRLALTMLGYGRLRDVRLTAVMRGQVRGARRIAGCSDVRLSFAMCDLGVCAD